ncbi:MAG TPA: IPT/TIG domain-containing protein, partial [Acidobacteriaceae bacterium]|nr:IPT/TIG domain-containing protein [Acidobacteriaceae bacterium]
MICSSARVGRVFWSLLSVAVLIVGARQASAGGPRFITGTSGYFDSGWPMAFYTSSPAYYTDPGDLNAAVTHAQADAMVAAAAAAWNVPTSSLVLAQGGALNEHVSGANTYFDGTQVVFPADVSAINWQNRPIAVIYDTDGSVIDTLMGYGASSPSGCRQTGVVESVDSFGGNGKIQHAMLILNGRCVGQNADQLMQMQYQVERAFGRILGLSWSQLNDNIFTGASQPTANQIANWPIMHPIDVLCSSYSYQCLTNPFQLRADDLSTLAYLYPVTSSNITTGKVLSATNAVYLEGHVLFPTGQGMGLVNVAVSRQLASHGLTETWQTASAITGALYQQNIGNPVTGPESTSENAGTGWSPAEERAIIQRVPDDTTANLYLNTEPINPLYTAEYALGPYQRPPVMPSGSPVTMVDWSARASSGGGYSQTVWDAASACAPGADGTQFQPSAADASGWWKGLLCSQGHSSWWSVTTKPGHSWTLEVTALNESGAPTMNKAQPVIGVWNAGDGGLPTVASAPVPMNSMALGVTQLQMNAGAAAATYTVAVADRYGAGRPDFAYQARMLYADSVSPQIVGSDGGQITVAGEGFRQGDQVLVSGSLANILSVDSNHIVARAPAMLRVGAAVGQSLNVTVRDAATGGSTTISGALSYSNVDVVKLVSAPSSLETGVPSSASFAVRVYAADGVTPVVGASVMFTVQAGSAVFVACAASISSCTVQTDATGLAQTTVT